MTFTEILRSEFYYLIEALEHGCSDQMSPAHLGKYVTEFSFRHNVLTLPCEKVMQKVFYNSNGKRLTYATLTNV